MSAAHSPLCLGIPISMSLESFKPTFGGPAISIIQKREGSGEAESAVRSALERLLPWPSQSDEWSPRIELM